MINWLSEFLYRIITSNTGYKTFVEVKECDTRLLMLQLVQMGNDFISYWTLELLSTLCRCPFEPRNPKTEFVNKHTMLNDKMLTCLIDLMTSRLDLDKSLPVVIHHK